MVVGEREVSSVQTLLSFCCEDLTVGSSNAQPQTAYNYIRGK
jgi:hypothetical protein